MDRAIQSESVCPNTHRQTHRHRHTLYSTQDIQHDHWCQINADGKAGQRIHTSSDHSCADWPTHTRTGKPGWWETPVAAWLHWCQHWANRGQLLTCQIYECYSSSVHVCMSIPAETPLAKPSLLHLLFLRIPSLSLSFILWKDWWAAWLPSILPDFLTEQNLLAIIHSTSPWECEKMQKCWQWLIEQ